MADVVQAGNASGVVGGTPQKADNTGRDWGEAAEIGGATIGTILGSILSWGAASPALIAGDAALIGADVAKDVGQNNSDAQNQQRQLQGQLDSSQKQRAQAQKPASGELPNALGNANFMASNMGSGQALKVASAPMPGASVGRPQMQSNNFSSFAPQPIVERAPVAQVDNIGTTITSDRRAKTNIKDGKSSVSDFLEAVRRHGAWPKSMKDPLA